MVDPKDDPSKPFCWKKLRAHSQALIQDIRDAHLKGQHKKAKHCQRLYLRSFSARLVATADAAKEMRPHRRPKVGLLPKIGEALDCWQGTDEEVVLDYCPKDAKPDEFRPVMKFGVKNRALQQLAGEALKARANLHPNQYAVQGGTHAAIAKTAKALSDGYHWAIETDIKDCYLNFDGEKVPGLLPLPKEVTKNVILSRDLNLSPGNFMKWIGPDDGASDEHYEVAQAIAEARRGIPQGSAVSPFAVEMLLAPVIAQLPTYGVVVAYADNILVLAREENEAVSMCLTLWSALESHPAGPLRPKHPTCFKPGDTVNFLGHALKVKNCKCRIEPSPANLWEFKTRFATGTNRVVYSSTPQRRQRLANDLARFVRSWSTAFSLWEGAAQHRAYHLERVKAAASAMGGASK